VDIIEATRAVLCALDERGCDVREVARDLHRLADAVELATLPTRKEYATLCPRRRENEWRWMILGAPFEPETNLGPGTLGEACNRAVALGWTVRTVCMPEEGTDTEALLVREAKP
jgi:hypothetical protein